MITDFFSNLLIIIGFIIVCMVTAIPEFIAIFAILLIASRNNILVTLFSSLFLAGIFSYGVLGNLEEQKVINVGFMFILASPILKVISSKSILANLITALFIVCSIKVIGLYF